ncbi:MAG: LPS export ABC transporter periplasmic protein LptC [Candidatus Binatia bacterium]
MRRRNRLILLVVIFLSLGGVAYKVAESIWIMNAQEIRRNPRKALDSLPESALQLKDFRRAKIEEGRKVWELFGEEANYYKEQKEAVIKKPRFYYYNKKGAAAETTGDTARLFFGERELEKMHLEGGIQVTYEGYVLKSEKAIYLAAEERIVLPTRATLSGNGVELEGSRMEVELEVKKVRMLQNVKTKIEPEKLAKKDKKSGVSQMSGG